ncbi:PD-(D/E)XK nuclease family protein [Salipaludibacillus sp. CF4.18]|uniref:PD-(D/E)XK nuclease family protein n=1 Tax=Salipaludibacillus sp. CF4.18 TaxID=3373081 RepID=UPI003EE69241
MGSSFTKMYDTVRKTANHSIEDYLTEMLAPMMECEEKLVSFMKKFVHNKFHSMQDIQVFTQRTYVKLASHAMDSRPDMVITFTMEKTRHIVFIENKLGSGEGNRQLRRYADHLKEQAKSGYHVHLIYMTKYYDPKQIEGLLVNESGSGTHQLQWYQFYQWLKNFEDNLYCKQVIHYMEGLGLNKNRQFTPADIHTIQNSMKIQSMLDDCLGGKVTEAFEKLFGTKKQWTNRAVQLRDEARYVLYNDQTDWKFVGCGLWLAEEEEDYPEVSIFMEVDPRCHRREEVLAAVDAFCRDHEGWNLEGPEDLNSWFTISFDQSLLHFLSAKDHIESIQTFMIEKLTELHQLKKNNPTLKWLEA